MRGHAPMDPWLNEDRIYRQFVDGLRDHAIIILDVNGNVSSWSPGVEALKGYTQEEILGRNFTIFYTPEARTVGHPERELAAASATGRYEEVGWRVRKDGSRFWAHVIIVALHDE